MKKTLSIVLTLALLFGLATTVKASTESDKIVEELSAYLEKAMDKVGVTIKLSDEQIAQLQYIAENLTDKFTVDAADDVKATIDELAKYMKDNKITDDTELTAKQIKDMLEITNDVANMLGIKISHDAKKDVIKIFDLDGKLILELSASDALAQTGGSNYAVVVAPAVAIIAVAAFIGIRKFNNK